MVFWSRTSVALTCAKTKSYTNSIDSAAQIITEYEDFIRLIIHLHIKDENSEEDIFQDFFFCAAKIFKKVCERIWVFHLGIIMDTTRYVNRAVWGPWGAMETAMLLN